MRSFYSGETLAGEQVHGGIRERASGPRDYPVIQRLSPISRLQSAPLSQVTRLIPCSHLPQTAVANPRLLAPSLLCQMAPAAASSSSSSLKGQWRPTKIMNMRDLSRDDDFLSHLLVEKLGTGDVPLIVHKMDPTRRLPKTNADDLLQIVQRVSVP